MQNRLLAQTLGIIVTSGFAYAEDDLARAYEGEILSDATHRTSLLSAQPPSLTVGGFIQFRYDLNSREDPPNDDGTTVGFSTRRTKLIFRGKVGERIDTFIQASFAPTGATTLDDAYGVYTFDNGIALKVGQFRMPFLREETVLETRQLGAERSAMNSVFNQGRSQGIQLSRQLDDWRWAVAFSDGFNAANTEFNSPSEAEYALTARTEFLILGQNWNRFNDFTSFMGEDMGIMAGAAAHWQSAGRDATGLAVSSLFSFTADISVEGDGWNAFAAAVWRHINPTGPSPDFDEFGIVIQGGIFLTPTWEPFARLDVVFPDDDRGTMSKEFTTITAGVNHYLIERSHAARLTFDVQYFVHEQSRSIVPASPALGLLPDTHDSQWNIRGQLQLAF